MELKIYNQTGALKLTVSTSASSTLNQELMVENAVSASFTHFFYVPLEVNDYVILRGVKYSINKEYKPKQKSTQEYTYSVKFYGPEHDAERVMYLNLTDGQYDSQFSLDGSPREHMQKWVDNMNRIYGSKVWSLGDIIVDDNKTIEYNNVNCWDALASIAETFNIEWWADGFVMNLTRCERGERAELGYLQGLTSLTQSENSNDVKFFTRLIPLGSTKNIDRSRYGYSRLQLPDKSTYVDRNTQYGLYEYVEETAFAEIYPRYLGTVTSVRSEEKTGKDQKKFIIYYFKDSSMIFDPSSKDNEIGGLVKHISFQTGNLSGRDFEANYNSTTKEWEIINTYPSDDVQIPGGNLIPEVGNKYIPWNFRMPTEYEHQAELEYKAAVDDCLLKYSEDISKYGGDTDYTYIDKYKIPLEVGQNVRLLSDEYFPGIGYRDTRMTKVVRKLDVWSSANIECTNQVGKGWKKQVDSSISQLKYVVAQQQEESILDVLKSWDDREMTDYRLLSALRTLKEIKRNALSRLEDDEAAGIITFLNGLISQGLIQSNGGLIVRSSSSGKELSTALSELDDEEKATLSSLISELGNGDSSELSTSLMEVSDGGFGSSTIGGMENTDESFDTVPDGTYLMNKRAGIYYPVKASAGGGSKLSLSFITSSNFTAVYGKETPVKYSFTSTLSGEDTGDGTVTYTLNKKLVASDTITQGEVTFNAGKYLLLGDNTLVVEVTDSYGATRKLTYNISTISLYVSSTFDESKAYTGSISFAYTPVGAIEKTAHFKVDGKEIGTATTSISNRQLTYSIPAQTHGSHSLEVYMSATIDGDTIESNHLYYDLICTAEGNNTPIIASSFRPTDIQQFDTINIPFYVRSTASTSDITLWVDGKQTGSRTVDRTLQTWSYKANKAGNVPMEIRCGTVKKQFSVMVAATSMDVEAETQDIELYLTSQNRSNSDTNREEWKYGNISATFQGMNWKTNGWVADENGYPCLRLNPGAKATVALNLFGQDFRTGGKTIEFEFVVRNVYNYDTPVISCWNSGRGIKITAQSATIQSEQSGIETKFKDEERIRLAFVVEKRADNRLLSFYVNGIKSGTAQYPESDNFMQPVPVGIEIGGPDATIDIYNIRSYNNNLNRYQLLDNYIADMDDIALKREIYSRNLVYDDFGEIDYEKVNKGISTITLIGSLPQYKGDKKTVRVEYRDYSDTSKSWDADGVEIDVQGTSSQYYPRKNYKLKLKKGVIFILNGTAASGIKVTEDVLEASVLCIKTDFAESSGTHNTGIANYADWMLKEMGMLTEAQKENPMYRTTVAGHPSVLFHKETDTDKPAFIGKINLNTDKGAENTFGFKDGDESWEFLTNTSDLALFKNADFSKWKETIEARYPDGGADIANVKKVFDWVVGCRGNQAKFKAECAQYFDKDMLVFYALITLILGMTDQRAKNMFLTRYRGKLWLFILYDNDTLLPINNEGMIALLYNVEIKDVIGSQNAWNGANSELWNLVDEAFADEMRSMYYTMRQKNILSYDRLVEYLFKRQAGKWCEAIYNEDGYYKYEQPLTEGYPDYSGSHENPQIVKTGAYLYALQGSREMYGKWIWKNRLLYLDSKFLAGSVLSDTAVFRTYTPAVWEGVKPCADITLTSFNAMYFNVKWGSVTKSQRVGFNETFKMLSPENMQFNDTETIIYGASLITSLGDLSGLYPGSVDVSKMTRLKELLIGSIVQGYKNYNLNTLYVGSNKLLKVLNVSNCPNYVQPIDVSGCDGMEELYAQGSSTTSVLLPEAGAIRTMHLPGTITSLIIRNQIGLTQDGLILDGISNLSTIRWENTNGVNVLAIIDRCLALSTIKLDRIRLTGVDWSLSTLDIVVQLAKMKGLDENGNNTGLAIVTGKCYATSVTESQLKKVKAAFPELAVTYGQLKPTPATTFTFSSSQNKSLTNAVFTCNVEYTKINEYTYKVAVEDGTTINLTYKADNHEEITKTYVTAGTRTQSYSVTYIPLRTIRVKVYNQSTYVAGATVTLGGKSYMTDVNGSVVLPRSGAAVSGSVSAYGYAGNTFSFSAITSDTTNTVEIYAAVDVKFVVKFGSALVEGATVKSGSQYGKTNVYGEVILPLTKGTHEYTVTHPDYYDYTGTVNVDVSALTTNVSLEINIGKQKPEENGNIQMLLQGSQVSVSITSSIAEYVIDWGDGTTSLATGAGTINYTHTYTDEKFYQVEVRSHNGVTRCIGSGSCLIAYWSVGNSQVNDLSFTNYSKLIYLGNVFKNDINRTSCGSLLSGCRKLTSVDLTPLASWVNVTSCYSLLSGCSSLTSVDLTPLASWVKVTNCGNLLYDCSSLTSVDFTPLASWVNVISCYSLLYGCSSLTSVDFTSLASWVNVTNCNSLLSGCSSLTSVDFTPLASWVNVTNCNSLLSGCSSLTSVDLTPLASWAKVTSCDSLLYGCNNLTSVDLTPLASWVKVTNCPYLLSGCSSLTSVALIPLASWVNVTNCGNLLSICSNLTSVDLTPLASWAKVTSCGSLLSGCSSLTSVDFTPLASWVNVISCYSLLYGCSSLTSVDFTPLASWVNVTSCSSLLYGCSNLTSVDLTPLASWVNVTNCGSLLYGCSSLTSVDLTPLASWAKVTSCDSLLSGCSSLTSVDFTPLASWVNVTICYNLLSSCRKLTSVDLTPLASWVNVTSCNSLLSGCSSLTSVDLTPLASWVKVTNCHYLLFGCSNLTSVDLTPLASWVNVTSCSSLLYGCSSLTYISILSATPFTLSSGALTNGNYCPIYVPDSAVETYKTATNWSYYASRIKSILEKP